MLNRLLILIVLISPSVFSEGDRYVTDILSSKLYLYNAQGEDIGSLKSGAVKKMFGPVKIGENNIDGLKIIAENDEEELVLVPLKGYPEGVWIESIAVKIEPGNQLNCPTAMRSQKDVEKLAMTVGFGEHCEDNPQ